MLSNFPPEAEKLLPFLKSYLHQKYNLSFFEELNFHFLDTENLLKLEKEKILGHLVLERILRENFENPFFSFKLLRILLATQPLSGYIFYFKGKPPKNYTFFRLENLYFYPLLFGRITELFIELWKKERSFLALYFELSEETIDLKEIQKLLRIQKTLGFTRLNRKAKNDLEGIITLYKNKGAPLKWHKALTNGRILLVSEKPLSPDLLSFLPPLYHLEDKANYYLYEKRKLDDLLQALSEEKNTLGIVEAKLLREEPFYGINPFLLGYATLEHAKRAGKRIHFLDGFTLHVLADLFYEWEDLKAALKFYQRAKPYTLQPIELALSEASIYYALRDLSKAKTILRGKLCGCIKEDPRIHYNLGLIYLEEGDRKNAEYHLYKAYLLDEREPLFRKTLLQFLWSEERYEEIEEILQKVSELTIDDKVFLGKVAFLKGDYQRALDLLQEILISPEKDGASLYFLAWLYMYFNKDKEASQIFLKEARERLSPEEFAKLSERFSLPK